MAGDTPRPTDTELRILNVLWDRGPSTVREVHAVLVAHKPVGYTTALKMLQVMADKGLVLRDDTEWPHRFAPRSDRASTQRRLLADLVDRAFGGSANALVVQALAGAAVTDEERDEIRRMLARAEEGSP